MLTPKGLVGRIVIATVGLPARGKTHLSVALARYLRWLGVKTRVFHLGDYRRQHVGDGNDVPNDYFFVNATPTTVLLRQKILKKCRDDISQFLNHENGQIAIYVCFSHCSPVLVMLQVRRKFQEQLLFRFPFLWQKSPDDLASYP